MHRTEGRRASPPRVAAGVMSFAVAALVVFTAAHGEPEGTGDRLPVEIDLLVDPVLESYTPEVVLPSSGAERRLKLDVGPAFLQALDGWLSRLFQDVRRGSAPDSERLKLALRLTGSPKLEVGRVAGKDGIFGECRIEVEVRLSEPGNRPALFQAVGEGSDVFEVSAPEEKAIEEAAGRCAARGAESVTSQLAGWFEEQYAEIKRNSRDAIAKSILRQAATSMEDHYTSGRTYAGATVPSLIASRPDGVELEIIRADAQGYQLRARLEGGNAPAWVLDSATMRIVAEGDVTPPSHTPPPEVRMRTVLHDAATAMEAYYATRNSYAGATAEALATHGFQLPAGISVKVIAGGQDYRIEASSPDGSPPLVFDSKTGRIESAR